MNVEESSVDSLDDATRLEQLKLIYDYVKFHIGLYLATPPVLVIVGEGLGIKESPPFRWGLIAMIGIYLISGISAGWFMGTHINKKWTAGYLSSFNDKAYRLRRRILHHWFYWLGLIAGLAGTLVAWMQPS